MAPAPGYAGSPVGNRKPQEDGGSANMKKTSLVTGGAGFIGSHLCDYLLGIDHRVICIDNLITGRMENIEHNLGNKDFIFIEKDITGEIEIDSEIGYIFHLASPASPIDYIKYPIQTLKAGSMGTYNILEIARKNGSVFILASTSEIYGDPKVHPQKEDYWGNVNPVGPRGVYDEAKRFAEAMTMAYRRQHGLSTHIARIFNTYGPRMRKGDGRAIPTFLNQVLEKKAITVFGDGSQTRSFCYVTDTIEALYRLALSSYYQPVNIGNPDEMTILEVVNSIKSIYKSGSPVVFKELPVDDPTVRCPDISTAAGILGWEPLVSFGEGIEKTYKWFKKSQLVWEEDPC
jgi:dTDP-glucose 4,6-dehydratase